MKACRSIRALGGLTLFALVAASLFPTVLADEPAQHSVARQWNDEVLHAIRIDIPKPTVHARNLYHVSVAMWDAWAAYDPKAVAVLVHERHHAKDVEAARNEAISYAAYRVLKHRYRFGPGEEASQAAFDARMAILGYDPSFTSTEGDSPAALGNRIGQAVVEFGLTDGANEGPMLDYVDDIGYAPVNDPLNLELPGTTMNDPNRWQPLKFDTFITQNGIEFGGFTQEFLGPNWGKVAPFALRPEDQAMPWVYIDPGPPPHLNGAGDAEYRQSAIDMIRFSSWVDPADGVTMDISPAVFHNNTLGAHDGTGYDVNPYTGEPYAPNVVKRADYVRVLAEFWADGPDSETPPGHWNTLANYVSDHPMIEKRIAGEGPVVDDLEWDVKLYLALNGGVHDAAITAWGCKEHYDYSRPISHIRYMTGMGQSSDPDQPSYHPEGIPLVPGLIEVITRESSLPGERHRHLRFYRNEIAIKAWNGIPDDSETQIGGVGWIRALNWLPYQRDTFVTPPFAGYVSGHSVFSRTAAEVLTQFTGSKYFPGGLGTFVAHRNEYLEFEDGPSETLTLQWATYYDASDEAGRSRLYGGIHPQADDFPGRIMGSEVGKKAFAKALEYYGPRGVDMCHKGRTIHVDAAALTAHLKHGDLVGECGVVVPDPQEKKRGR